MTIPPGVRGATGGGDANDAGVGRSLGAEAIRKIPQQIWTRCENKTPKTRQT